MILMKKQIFILIFVILPLLSPAQDERIIKMNTPCSEEFLQNVKGRWLDYGAGLNATISKQEKQEIFKRLDKIHQFVFNIYPSPVGFDAAQSRHTFDDDFAYQVKLDHLENGNTRESRINGVPVVRYYYEAYFGRYSCAYNDNHKMVRGLPSEDVELFQVYANAFTFLEGGSYEMNIDGRKILMMPAVKGNWKGCTTFYIPEQGKGKTYVLLHRDGMLPYTIITRKQYLDFSISYLEKWYDKMIADVDKNAKAFIDAGMTDLKSIQGGKENLQKQKKDVLKHYNDELAATTAAGLLDAPAVIPFDICDTDPGRPIFTTQEAGGRLLVIENFAYMRKDLPKYIPQFFVLTFEWTGWSTKQKRDALNVVYENFSVEQLQAMIDK